MVDKFRQLAEKRKILIAFLIILIILTILYFKVFFTRGAYFNDLFLKKEAATDETCYIGKNKQGDFKVTVKRTKDTYDKSEVIYSFPKDIKRHFIVNFKNEYNWDDGVKNITDKDGNILFEGIYIKGSPYLYGENGDIIFQTNQDYRFDVLVDSNIYELPLINVMEFATYEIERIRGDAEVMAIALLILFIVAIDIKYPLLFFNLSHFIEVKNPEPTDFYIFTQKIMWIVFPILSIILLIVAI
jgi:hypothetical protein